MTLIPIFMLILTLLTREEKIGCNLGGLSKVGGILLAVGGAIVMIGLDGFTAKNHNVMLQLLGNACLIGNGISITLYIYLQRALVKKYSPICITFWNYSFGTIFILFPTISTMNDPGKWKFVPSTWIAIVYSALLSSALAFFLVCWSVKRASGIVIALFSAFQPLSTVLLSYLVLHETVTVNNAIGAPFVLFGLCLACYAKFREEKASSAAKLLDSDSRLSESVNSGQ